MSFSGTMTKSWSVDGQTTRQASNTQTGTVKAGVRIDSLASPFTNHEEDVALPIAGLQFIVFNCTQDCTIKTNSSGSPAQTITLKANEPLDWALNSSFSNPITTDITKLFVSIAATDTAPVFTVDAIYA